MLIALETLGTLLQLHLLPLIPTQSHTTYNRQPLSLILNNIFLLPWQYIHLMLIDINFFLIFINIYVLICIIYIEYHITHSILSYCSVFSLITLHFPLFLFSTHFHLFPHLIPQVTNFENLVSIFVFFQILFPAHLTMYNYGWKLYILQIFKLVYETGNT